MNEKQMILIGVLVVIFIAFLVIVNLLDNKSLNGIKSKRIGDGQHGTARWATKTEIKRTFIPLPFEPDLWRQGKNLPAVQGTVVGCRTHGKNTVALVDNGDVHTLMIGAAGVGKTAFFLYPNIEFACASGMSFINTDCKGDVARNYGTIASKYYGYNVSVLDLRNPTRSDENNILHLVNKYMDIYLSDKTNLSAKAKAEKYAKITAKTIINIGGGDSSSYGQNAFFYDAAEGLLASVILLLAEFGDKNERHIVSVFKLIQDLLAKYQPNPKAKPKMYFSKLMDKLPSEHKAKWLAGAALNSSDQSKEKAVKLLEKAIKLENINAKRFLALEYISGEHLEQDIGKGLAMLTECADSGDAFASYKLGKIYFKGEIVLQNLDKAEKYLLLAEDNEFTQYALGKLYLQKEKYDVRKAVDYFEKSADRNNWSSYQLGRLYLFGAEGIEKDKEQATQWLTKSANDGNEYAQNMLNNMAQFENAVLANTIFGLFANLSRCVEDDYTQKYKSVRRTVDSRLRRMIHRKKQLLGMKEDFSQSFD